MTTLWLFQRPAWLLLLPLLGLLLWQWSRRRRRGGRWETLLPARYHALLLHGGGDPARRGGLLALGLGGLLAILALAGPGWPQTRPLAADNDPPLVAILEVTPRMLAGDAAPNRLEQAKRKLRDLLERRSGYTAVVVYAGSAHVLVPLSNDLATTLNLLDALRPSIMPRAGQRADLAVKRAIALLRQAQQGGGQVLLITAGLDAEERAGIAAVPDIERLGLRVLGVGSEQGAPIPREDGSFVRDANGAIELPRLDSGSLRRFALEIGGRYARAAVDGADLAALNLTGASRSGGAHEEQRRGWVDQGHWLLLPLLLLAACAARRGWLFALLLCVWLPPPAQAMSFADLWLRADQQGLRLLQEQRPQAAAQRFSDPRWRALALYRSGDYAAAAQLYAQGESAVDRYNQGTALARAGDLAAARQALREALQLDPELEDARTNLPLVEAQLAQQASAAPQSPDPSQADDQGIAAPDSTNATPADGSGDALSRELDAENEQALEQWLRQVPDDPAELLRRKFWYERQQQESAP